MIAYALDALLSLFLLGALLWTVAVLWQAACEGHRRGLARVHAGTSWAPTSGPVVVGKQRPGRDSGGAG